MRFSIFALWYVGMYHADEHSDGWGAHTAVAAAVAANRRATAAPAAHPPGRRVPGGGAAGARAAETIWGGRGAGPCPRAGCGRGKGWRRSGWRDEVSGGCGPCLDCMLSSIRIHPHAFLWPKTWCGSGE